MTQPMPAARRPPKPPRPEPVPRTDSPHLSALEKELSDPQAAAAAHLRLRELLDGPLPLLEEDPEDPARQIVTFLYEDDEAEQVLLFANRLTDESALGATLMHRLGPEGPWHASFRMRRTWRASYCFIPARPGAPAPWISAQDHVQLRAALDAGVPDPRNGLTCPNRDGRALSVVELADAPVQPYVFAPADETQLVWHAAPEEHRVALHRSTGADPQSPVILVFDGEVWARHGLIGAVEQAVRAGDLAPVHLVLLDSGGRQRRWRELDGTEPIHRYIAEALLPWLRAEHGLDPAPARTCAVGQSLGGLASLLCGLLAPRAVGAVVSQSASLWQEAPARALAELLERDGAQALADSRFVLEVGDQEWVLTGPHDDFARELRRSPARVEYLRYDGGHDYACWRGSLIPALVRLYPAD